MEWRIKRYCPEDREVWDNFVRSSRNSTFLFERGYMDYHSDRFPDCSWMAFKGKKLRALLPANIDNDNILHSHQGLTYGGWLLPPEHLDGADLVEIFREAVDVWRKNGIKALDYKPLPYIYSAQPSEEDIYALFRLGAKISEVNLSSAVNLRMPIRYNKLRKRALKKAEAFEPIIEEITDCHIFMTLVEDCLRERHNTSPVHSSEEVSLLKERFPDNIRMFGVRTPDSIRETSDLEAGVMIYDTGRVAHAQYIATTPRGRERDLLTPLFIYLMENAFSDREYFDFGISNEDHGLYLNEGLLRQKFSYGATGVTYNRFYLKL